MTDGRDRDGFSPVRTILVVGSLAVVAACLTVVFLAMRAVMDIGGFCAEGGPYSIETHCPQGTPALLMGGIWIGVIAAIAYTFLAIRARAVNLAGLFWSALFLSLGWNFLEYGISPPFDGGLAWGWLIPGVLFVLMGGLPLLWVLPLMVRADSTPRNVVGVVLSQGAVAARQAVSERRSGARPTQPARLVDELERLAHLHRRGSLSDLEYEDAKRRLLEEE